MTAPQELLPAPEPLPGLPRTFWAADVRIADVEQMVGIIGGEATLSDMHFSEIPHLVLPHLGIEVRFGERYTRRNPDPSTTISVRLGSEDLPRKIVFVQASVDMSDDAVVITRLQTAHERENGIEISDKVTLTRKSAQLDVEGVQFEISHNTP